MKIFSTVADLRRRVDLLKGHGKRIGFVPTMGYLHEGHLSLIDRIKRHCDEVVVSIFVNPKQFAPGEDVDRYPRDFKRDCALLEKRGADFIFHPTESEIYPDDFLTYVHVEELGKLLCGRSRPSHFRGVTTVVAKLFMITKCDVAAFGQKDYQQSIIIKKMVEDLSIDVEVLVFPTVREEDGLALSSRNTYLSAEDRSRAVCLFEALKKAEELYKSGENHAARLREEMLNTVSSTPEVIVDYLEVVDAETLQPVDKIKAKTLLAGAIWIHKTRLIDNTLIGP